MGCQLAAFLTLAVVLGAAVGFWARRLESRRQDRERLFRLESDVASLTAQVGALRQRLATLDPAGAEADEPAAPPAFPAALPRALPSALPSAAAPPPFAGRADAPLDEESAAASAEPLSEDVPSAIPELESAAGDHGELPPPSADDEPPMAPPPSPPERPPIDWERWIGVRGAALVAGILLALAGIYFVRYWIEAGLLTPRLRVALGWLGGVGAVLGSETLRRRGYDNAANGLAGAGIVGLYAATWAAHDLYGLVPAWMGFAVMGLITVAGGVLAWRHASAVVAVLGLLGGFATPLLVSSEEQSPLSLFGYLLLLNLGIAAVARRFAWPWLSLLGLVLTVGYQALWLLDGLDPDGLWLALLVLGVFAAFYLGAGRLTDRIARADDTWGEEPAESADQRPLGLPRQLAGLGSPFLFAIYFAAQADLDVELWSLFLLLGPLTVAACWLARAHRQPFYELAAIGANLAVGAVWTFGDHESVARAWQATAFAVLLGLVHHLFHERDRRRGEPGSMTAATLAAGSFLLGLGVAPVAHLVHGPGDGGGLLLYLAGVVLLAVMLLRQAALSGRGAPSALAGLGVGVSGAVLLLTVNEDRLGLPDPLVLLAIFGLLLAGLQGWALTRHRRAELGDGERRAWLGAEAGAAVAGFLVLASTALCFPLYERGALTHHLVLLLFGVIAVLPSLRARWGWAYAPVVPLLAALQSAWHVGSEGAAAHALVLQLATIVVLTLLPLFARPPLATLPIRMVTAVAGALWFPSLYFLWLEVLPDASGGEGVALGALPLALGAIALLGAARAGQALEEPPRKSALAWLGAAALGWVAVAVPLQLEKEWVTVGWALMALGVTALWRRLDHAGLKLLALALHLAVFVRLALNPALLQDYPAFAVGGLPVLNWLLYTYGIPIASLLLSARLLAGLEVERARDAERGIYASGRPLVAGLCSMMAVVLGFVWLNLTVFDAFSPGAGVALPTERLGARDLTLSLAWALYAFLLLGLGVAKRSSALRWTSLVFLVLAIGKAFLYDLGELTDLYRVASLAGLAITLLLVSILYQRFVFGRDRSAPAEPAP